METIESSYSIREKSIPIDDMCERRFYIIVRTDKYIEEFQTNDGYWHWSNPKTISTPISVIEKDRFVAEELVKELESIEKEIHP